MFENYISSMERKFDTYTAFYLCVLTANNYADKAYQKGEYDVNTLNIGREFYNNAKRLKSNLSSFEKEHAMMYDRAMKIYEVR